MAHGARNHRDASSLRPGSIVEQENRFGICRALEWLDGGVQRNDQGYENDSGQRKARNSQLQPVRSSKFEVRNRADPGIKAPFPGPITGPPALRSPMRGTNI